MNNDYQLNGQNFGWGPGVASLNPEKADLLKKFARGKCLDIGFGSGIYTKHLLDLGHTVSGVDNQESFVEAATKKYPQVSFIVGNATELPFRNQEFQTAIVFDILEHLDDVRALREISRVAKRIIFSVPLENQGILLSYGLSHAHYLDHTHIRVYSIDRLRKLLSSKHYKIIYLHESLPLSISGLLIDRLARHNKLLKLILKIILKPFMPEPPLYSTIFGVIEKKFPV